MTQLLKSEKIYLKDNFRMVDYAENVSVKLDQLMDEEYLRNYLQDIKHEFNTESIFVAGSQLMKRLGFNIALPALYLMTVHDMKLDMTFNRAGLVSNTVGDKWLPNLYMDQLSVEKMSEERRETERQVLTEEIFQKLDKLVNVFNKVSRVPRPNLWENIAIYVYWLYEKKLKEERFSHVAKRVEEDYEYLIRGLSANAFTDDCNQLTNFYWGRRIQVDGTRIRRTCCFYYGANSDRKCCSTCPKSPEDAAKPLPFETVKSTQ
ncbi:IucA/IucC family C-terminal-domain containing protein [Aquisalibacillus elongatus]|uniref:Ferric iron reductase FhuF-like transporter n=1 Tax=Aquisalibacillus elongatus TaxID=485577 RepID=A0A3N5C9N5_9BACI|nr:IucA/IucC family C-terminal-domain containing protein [Aquisalibacillus elongatus]RPF53371.1 ferric iron reductase FhuF-like transporter [Aquisalibacillus elongatus]